MNVLLLGGVSSPTNHSKGGTGLQGAVGRTPGQGMWSKTDSSGRLQVEGCVVATA